MPYSNHILLIIFIPNNGNVLIINGKMAQCMAHAIEATIPNASKFILKNFICLQSYIIATKLQKQ
jgi:hypothetical protein